MGEKKSDGCYCRAHPPSDIHVLEQAAEFGWDGNRALLFQQLEQGPSQVREPLHGCLADLLDVFGSL